MKLTRFNAFIKRKTGYSPFQYLISLRVEAAKDYLTNSTLNITQIALEYSFVSSFISDAFVLCAHKGPFCLYFLLYACVYELNTIPLDFESCCVCERCFSLIIVIE